MARLLLALVSGFILVSLAPLPDSISAALTAPSAQEGCRRCDKRGVVPCGKHSEEILAAEGRVHFCSVVAGCKECGGALVVDCKRCEGGPENAAMEARRVAVAEWMKQNEIEAHFGRPVARCETDHCELVFDLKGSFKVGRTKIDAHELMHLVADDTSHVCQRVVEHHGVEEEDIFAKMRMWIWESADDHKSAVETFMHTSARGDFKMLGKDPVFSVWREPGLFSSPGAIRTVFTHNVGHMMISNMFRERDVGPIGGGWYDAGAGHWYEYDRFDSSVQYCIEEATALSSFADGVWRAAMRKLVARSDEPLLPPLLDVPTTAMNVQQQAICWSFYDWIVANHQDKMRLVLRDLKQKKPTREVMREHFGVGVLQAEEAWKQWVLDTYPTREKKKRR